MVCEWFDLKTTQTVFFGLTLKPVGRISRFGPQNQQLPFGDLILKITATVSWFVPQTKQASVYRLCHKIDGGRTVWDTRRDLAAYFVWKQVTVGFFSLALRLAEARRWVVHMAPSRRLRRDHVEDGRVDMMGCVRPCYPCFAVFNVLCSRGIVVI
jgi:hypothetical protein